MTAEDPPLFGRPCDDWSKMHLSHFCGELFTPKQFVYEWCREGNDKGPTGPGRCPRCKLYLHNVSIGSTKLTVDWVNFMEDVPFVCMNIKN